jgi:hypothetical protein
VREFYSKIPDFTEQVDLSNNNNNTSTTTSKISTTASISTDFSQFSYADPSVNSQQERKIVFNSQGSSGIKIVKI